MHTLSLHDALPISWKFIWPPTGKVVLAVRESQIIAEEELSKSSENGQLPIMK